MNRLSNSTIDELNRLGFQKMVEDTIDRDSYFSLFLNANINFTITIVNSPKEVKDTWLVTAFNRGENCRYDLNTIEGINVDEKGRAQFESEKNIVLFINNLINKIKKDRGEIIEEELEKNKINEEKQDTAAENIVNTAISDEEYQALTDEEKSHFYTKEELKYIFNILLYAHTILVLYDKIANSGCEILSSIITTTNKFKEMHYELWRTENPDYSTYPNIKEPKKNIYTEEEILNELRKLPEAVYAYLLERTIEYYYNYGLTSKMNRWIDRWIDIIFKPKELKEIVNNYPYLIEISASYGCEKVVKKFIDAGIDMTQNNTALLRAAREGHEKVVKMLLDIGCPIDDAIALVGANSGNPIVAKLLIEAGADYTTGRAGTSIINAVEAGNVEMVKILLEAGSDPTIEGYRLFNSAYTKGKEKGEEFREIYELLELYNKKQILKEFSKDLADKKEVESSSEFSTISKK